MDNCIFCRIVKGQIPCAKVYENDKVLAFLDINPVNPGHTLVIPKEHYEHMEQVPDDLLKEIIVSVKKVTIAVKKGVDTDSTNLGVNNGKTAGQLVPHVHFHIMPRFPNDRKKLWEGKPYQEGQMSGVQKNIAKYL
jgi:histidine triad (HIT) family protein